MLIKYLWVCLRPPASDQHPVTIWINKHLHSEKVFFSFLVPSINVYFYFTLCPQLVYLALRHWPFVVFRFLLISMHCYLGWCQSQFKAIKRNEGNLCLIPLRTRVSRQPANEANHSLSAVTSELEWFLELVPCWRTRLSGVYTIWFFALFAMFFYCWLFLNNHPHTTPDAFYFCLHWPKILPDIFATIKW